MEENKNIPEETLNNNDEYVIGNGFKLDTNEPITDKKAKKNKKESKGILKTIIWISSIIIVSFGLAFGIIFIGADFMGIGFGRGNTYTLEIEKGTPASKVAEQLEESGAVKVPLFFRLYSKLKGYDSQFKYGVYTFNTESGYEELCQMLITEGASAKTVTVKIPELATVDDIAKLLSDADVCSKGDFIDAVQNGDFNYDFIKDIPKEKVHYRLEGYLFPDTYDFYCYESSECAQLAVAKMLENLHKKLTADLKEKINESSYSFNEIMTMASIIESESANGSDEDRSKVAAVFYNRLEGKNWDGPKFLQTDPSTFYPYGGGRYNTYKTEGLPPGPIGSPSIASIKAALNPKKDFKPTYFVTDKNAKFYFNETLSAHERTIADLKNKGLWLYTTLGSN